MHTHKHFSRFGGFAALPLAFFFAINPVAAQTAPNAVGQSEAKASASTAVMNPLPAALDTELGCAGYIEYEPNYNGFEVVGGEQEQEQHAFGMDDVVYINAGAQQGIKVGQEFQVVRPRGKFRTKLTSKSGALGVYTQEVGRLRVTVVKDGVSVAQITNSCEPLLLGDLLRSVPNRVSPSAMTEVAELDRFADPSGKQKGRIVLAREAREMITRTNIVYIDLGTEDNLKEGDRLTVYRPVGTGDISRFRDEEVTPSANYGFESERFRGGRFSIQAQRVQNPNGNERGPMITTPKIERRRPPMPRKIVGEMVVLNVQARTATAVITRVAQEIHTGDFVEVK